MRRDVRRDRAAGALPARRVTVAGEVRPRPASARDPRSIAGRRAGPLALPRAAAGLGRRARRHPRRGDDPAAARRPASAPSSACRDCWSRTRGCCRPARSRRAAPPSASPAPRSWASTPDRHADQRQRGRGLVDVRRPGRHARHHRDAAWTRPTITRARVASSPAADLHLVDGLIADAGRLIGAAVAGQRGRLVRGVDAQGAVPDRGQEDDGAGDRRAAGLADARRDPLPDRRRRRADRHPQGAASRLASWAGSRATCRGWCASRRPGARRSSTAFEAGADGVGDGRGLLDGRVRHQRAQGARRLPGARRGARDRRDRRRGRATPTCWPTSP